MSLITYMYTTHAKVYLRFGTIGVKMHTQVAAGAAGALIFIFRQSYTILCLMSLISLN